MLLHGCYPPVRATPVYYLKSAALLRSPQHGHKPPRQHRAAPKRFAPGMVDGFGFSHSGLSSASGKLNVKARYLDWHEKQVLNEKSARQAEERRRAAEMAAAVRREDELLFDANQRSSSLDFVGFATWVRDRLRLLGSRYRDEERLEQWFEALDVDGDGLITRAEFFVLAMQEAIARSAGETISTPPPESGHAHSASRGLKIQPSVLVHVTRRFGFGGATSRLLSDVADGVGSDGTVSVELILAALASRRQGTDDARALEFRNLVATNKRIGSALRLPLGSAAHPSSAAFSSLAPPHVGCSDRVMLGAMASSCSASERTPSARGSDEGRASPTEAHSRRREWLPGGANADDGLHWRSWLCQHADDFVIAVELRAAATAFVDVQGELCLQAADLLAAAREHGCLVLSSTVMAFIADVSGVPFEKYLSIRRLREWIDQARGGQKGETAAEDGSVAARTPGEVSAANPSTLARGHAPLTPEDALAAATRAHSPLTTPAQATTAVGSRAAFELLVSTYDSRHVRAAPKQGSRSVPASAGKRPGEAKARGLGGPLFASTWTAQSPYLVRPVSPPLYRAAPVVGPTRTGLMATVVSP